MTHAYLSTACLHRQCGSCRNTCKFCDAPCTCDHHGKAVPQPEQGWVDQARQLAGKFLWHIEEDIPLSQEMKTRIAKDPALFWLRGEVQPPGEHPLGGITKPEEER